KLTTTSTSINASVATIPARAAAAMVAPFACGGLLAAMGAYATWADSGCTWPPPEAHTEVHECRLAFEVNAAAAPAGATASTRPAAMAAALRRTIPIGSHTRLRLLVPIPVS